MIIMSEENKSNLTNIKPGALVRVHQILKEKNAKGEMKERVQIFEGTVIAHKWGKSTGATFTVRKLSGGIGVERIFPVHSPWIQKVEMVEERPTRKNKLYPSKKNTAFLRTLVK